MDGPVNATQLRGARAMLQWTSTDLAKRSGIRRRTIRKLEKDEAQPQRKTLAAIVGALSAAGVEFIGAEFSSPAVNAKTELCSTLKRAGAEPASAPRWSFWTRQRAREHLPGTRRAQLRLGSGPPFRET
jgi:transcriptional regulator with XRE-family HTH domain